MSYDAELAALIDPLAKADTDSWRTLAAIAGLSPTDLEESLDMLLEPDRSECQKCLDMYRAEIREVISRCVRRQGSEHIPEEEIGRASDFAWKETVRESKDLERVLEVYLSRIAESGDAGHVEELSRQTERAKLATPTYCQDKSEKMVAVSNNMEVGHEGRCLVDVLVDVKSFLADPRSYEDRAVQASILFADLVGSTEFKRYHSLREGLAKVAQHNDVVTDCCTRFGGSVVKYAGDGVMVMFEGQQSECRALQAGLETIQRMQVENGRLNWSFPFSMVTKIGMHSGPVWMFKYGKSPDDPQGTTVDIAARLTSLAGSNQVLCTKQTYETAANVGAFPRPRDEFRRYLRGIKERFDLTVIMPDGYCYDPPAAEGPLSEVETKLKEAYRLMHEKKPADALAAFKRISDENPDNYHANISVAEYLLKEPHAGGQEGDSRLFLIADYIDKAMCSQPTSYQVWLLQGSLDFRRFETTRDIGHIKEAVKCARKAIHFADAWRNAGAMLQTRVCLIHFLQALAREGRDKDALNEAHRLCLELEPSVEHAFDDCRSDFYVAYASVQLQSGSADFDAIEKMLKHAKERNPWNVRVYELELDVVKRRHPDGGIAAVMGVPTFD